MPYTDPEKARLYHQNYYREYMRKWRAEHPDSVRITNKKAEEKRQGKRKEEFRIYYNKVKNIPEWQERRKEYDKKWYNNNKERHHERVKRHRVRKRFAEINDLTSKQWQSIKAHYRYRCVYCNKKTIALTQDHITPISKGGNHTVQNVVPACKSCNSAKRDRKAKTFIQPLLLL